MSLGRVLTAMITPFSKDGSLNYNKAQELASYLVANGSDGIVVGGTTGESSSLTYNETIELFKCVKEAVGDKGCVVGGAGSNCTHEITNFIKDANKIQLDGYLSIVPYYNKPTQEGVYRHFKAVSEASELPIILYNIPGRTGINMVPDTVVRLAEECSNIVAMKDSTGDVDRLSELKVKLPKDFSIYSGDDFMNYTVLAHGGYGVVSVATHLVGNEIKEMINCVLDSDINGALDLHLKLYPMFKGLFCTANPIPVKTALNMLGKEVGGFRSPMCEASEVETKFIEELLKKYDLLG